MSKPSPEYLAKVETCFRNDITIERANMTTVQKYRTIIVYEAFQFWLNDKDIRPLQLMTRLASRDYLNYLHRAEGGDEIAQMFVKDLNIRYGANRSINELSNDVYVLNWFIDRYTTNTSAIEKARDKESIGWLIREGKKTGDTGAVAKGVQLSMALNDNYKEKENAADQIPNTLLNISGDVSIVHHGKSNYTDEEKELINKRYRYVTEKDIQQFQENESGIMESVDEENPEDKDVFLNEEDQ